MSTQLNLRDYQREAIDKTMAARAEGFQRPAVVLSTGLGKTVIFSHLISEYAHTHGRRAVVLVHRDELADQAIDKIRSVAPHLRVGKVKAESDEITADVMVCSVQTLAVPRRLERLRASESRHGRIGLAVVDECHHAAAETYQTILRSLGCFGGNTLAVGFTATMARGDNVGLGDTWQTVISPISLLRAISRGFLTDVRGKSVSIDIDFGGVKRSGGDYQSGDLGRALEDSDMERVLPGAYREHAGDRPGVVFTPTVATAHSVAESFNAAGVRTAVVSGETPREERQRIYTDYRTGKIQVLSNCMVLTEGFDAPWASCAVIARPTQSQPLYIQMVGRVLRPWPGKKDALVLDVTGVGGKLATLIDLTPGQVGSLNDGESLTEAVTREEQTGPRPLGDLKFKDLDLFAGSSQSWLVTKRGIMFIPVVDGDVFLWAADDGTWDVGYAPKQGSVSRLHKGLPLGTATAWAETEAEERMPFSTTRSASWRKKKPSEKQIETAKRMGLVIADDMRSGDVGNLMSIEFASKRLDRFVRN